MPTLIPRKTELYFLKELAKVREGRVEVYNLQSSLSKCGEDAVRHFLRENGRSYTPEVNGFGHIENPELSDMKSGLFVKHMNTIMLSDKRSALYSENPSVLRSPSVVIEDWFNKTIMVTSCQASGMFQILHTQRDAKMYKKGHTAPKTFADAFPTLDKWMVHWKAPLSLDTPQSPKTPRTPTVFWGMADPDYVPRREDTTEEELKRCIGTLATKDRQIWVASEASRAKKMARMKGELKGNKFDIMYFHEHQDRKRGAEMMQLAGPVYRTLKRKY